MFTVASVSPGRKGGELASAVHAYTKTGDPSMRSLVQHILSLVSHPVLSFLYRWIYDGELEDTHHEVRRRLLRAAGRRAHPEVRRAFGVSSKQPGAGPILRCLLRAVGRQAHPRASLSSRHRIEQSCVCLVGNGSPRNSGAWTTSLLLSALVAELGSGCPASWSVLEAGIVSSDASRGYWLAEPGHLYVYLYSAR